MKRLCTIFGILAFINAYSQDLYIEGKVIDAKDNSVLIGSTIIVTDVKDSTSRKGTVTDQNGMFKFNGLAPAFYKIRVTNVGYVPLIKYVRVTKEPIFVGELPLKEEIRMLNSVDVHGEIIPVEQKSDTTSYNANAYKTNPDASTEDLISKMPGIFVNGSSITAQGENIEQVLLDGKRFFGDDPMLALRSIPADIVDKIEVFDQLSERSRFTGYNDGNTTKTLNVVTKEDKRKGTFGRAFAGAGTNDTYNVGGNINVFDGPERISVLGMANNINNQNFSNEDLLGLSNGGRRRGGGGGSRGMSGGSNNSFITDQQRGISETQAIGTNYTNSWAEEKSQLEASYFLNRSKNRNNQYTNTETFQRNGSSQYTQDTLISSTINWNHRLNIRWEYKFNERNSIVFRPNISYQANDSYDNTIGLVSASDQLPIYSSRINNNNENEGYRLNSRLQYRHAFKTKGRTMTMELSSNMNNTDYYEDLNSNSVYYRNGTSLDSIMNQYSDKNQYKNTYSANVMFTEKLGRAKQFEYGYEVSWNNNNSDKKLYLYEPGGNKIGILDTALSNIYNSDYITHSPSVNFRITKWNIFFNAGMAYQYAILDGAQVYPYNTNINKDFNNILPSLMCRTELGKNSDLFFMYRTSTNSPNISQLQDVVNNSNTLFLSTGNPNLEQSYSHRLITRHRVAYPQTNSSLSNFVMVNYTTNYITSATIIPQEDMPLDNGIVLVKGAQLNYPVNMDGYWSIQTNTSYGMPAKAIKSNINFNVGLNYEKTPGMSNERKNISNNYSLNGRLVVASNISKNIDFTVSYGGDYYIINNTLNNNQDYLNQSLSAKFNLIFWKGFVFRSNIDYKKSSGYQNSANNIDYTLWTMGLAKKFLKDQRGEIQLSVFDLLNENQSISRKNTATYIEELRNDVIRQYFMLTFTYTVRSFLQNQGGGNKENNRHNRMK